MVVSVSLVRAVIIIEAHACMPWKRGLAHRCCITARTCVSMCATKSGWARPSDCSNPLRPVTSFASSAYVMRGSRCMGNAMDAVRPPAATCGEMIGM
jgi:hypothetical protein